MQWWQWFDRKGSDDDFPCKEHSFSVKTENMLRSSFGGGGGGSGGGLAPAVMEVALVRQR